MSLGLRLTLLNGLVLLLALVAFAVVVYITQQEMLERDLDASLAAQSREFSSTSRLSYDRFSGNLVVIPPDINVFAASHVFIQVSSQRGDIVGRSQNLGDARLPVNEEMLREALEGKEWHTQAVVDGQLLRLFVAPLRVVVPPRGETINAGMILVARPLEPTYTTLRQLHANFVVVGAAGVLVSLLVGWLLARAALRPIHRLAATAHAISSAQDVRRRVPLPPGRRARRDEVGRLADEFNGMLSRLQAAYEQLETALAAQRRFVADASHELRTPLTSLRGNVDLLRRVVAARGAPPPAEHEQVLADMASETERMAHLVADLLLLAQADAGQHLALEPTPLAPVVRDAFRTARFLREGVELRLGSVVEDAWVDGDPERLKQLLLILLDNGLKYTPRGGTVAIEAVAETWNGAQHVVVRVEDGGPGVPEEARGHIFERFYRADSARADGGAGLGLAIARWLAEEHRGSIEVQGAPGGGSVFSVRLPTIPIPPRDAEEPEPVALGRPIPSPAL